MAVTEHSFQPKKILVIGSAWAGDMVMSQALFKVLKMIYPMAAIDVLAPPWTLGLLARMPEVNQAIEFPLRHGELGLAKRWRIARQLRKKAYDWAIVLPGSLKSALVPLWAGVPRRTGYTGECRFGFLNDRQPLDKKKLRTTVARFVALSGKSVPLGPENFPRLKTSPEASSATVQELNLPWNPTQRLAILCPGAEYGPAKRWPATHYAALVALLVADQWQVWIMGSAKDLEVANQIDRLSGYQSLNLAGKTSLAQACDLLALADVVVTNDSGLMHVAAGLGRKLVAIYGSSDPQFTPPLSLDAKVMHLDLSCSPCFARTCPLGHLRCLDEITPEAVNLAIKELTLARTHP